MKPLDPITVAALEALNLDTDRLPGHPRELAQLVHEKCPIESFTWEQSAAYKHLHSAVKNNFADYKNLKLQKMEKAKADLLARQVLEEECAS